MNGVLKFGLWVTVGIATLMAHADKARVGGIWWTYSVVDGEAQLVDDENYGAVIDTSTTGAITIPSTLGGCPVTSIGDYAFEFCSDVTSVAIPEGVTSIGEGAFSECYGLCSVSIPGTVTSIGTMAFGCCMELKDVVVPEGVKSIGNYAFDYCSGLTNVTIATSVTSIGGWAFYGCEALPNVVVPMGVTAIAKEAFAGCTSLTDVTIPSSVSSMAFNAFGNCPLERVVVTYKRGEDADAVVGAIKSLLSHVVNVCSVDDIAFTPQCIDSGDSVEPPDWASWASRYKIGFEDAKTTKTGKVDCAGNELTYWDEFVQGTDPTSEFSTFKLEIEFDNGVPKINWTPKLPADRAAYRSYKVFGSTSFDSDWSDVTDMTDAQRAAYRFFKMSVTLK